MIKCDNVFGMYSFKLSGKMHYKSTNVTLRRLITVEQIFYLTRYSCVTADR